MDTFAVQVGRCAPRFVPLTVWLRGTEVAVKGYVEPTDFAAGMMQESLVIEELRPVTPNSRWRRPDIDELLDSGEYQAITNAFWDTWHAWGDFHWYVSWADDYEPSLVAEQHEEWREYWLGARKHTLAEALDPLRGTGPIAENE